MKFIDVIKQYENVKHLSTPCDMSEMALEYALVELNCLDNNFKIYVSANHYHETMKCLSIILAYLDRPSNPREMVTVVEELGNDWILGASKSAIYSCIK